MWINMAFVCGIIFLSGFVGLVMYSRYFDCDPLTSQVRKALRPFQMYEIKNHDELFVF